MIDDLVRIMYDTSVIRLAFDRLCDKKNERVPSLSYIGASLAAHTPPKRILRRAPLRRDCMINAARLA